MIRYRPFLNIDPPQLIRVWRAQQVHSGLMQPISVTLLEMFVLSKPYFDRRGLIVALEDERVIGFAHGGFGPTQLGDALSKDIGVISMLLVEEHPEQAQILAELIQHQEGYLRGQGAIDVRAGAHYPLSPFYLGMNGGSDIPGINSNDKLLCDCLLKSGYDEADRCYVYQLDLADFRPTVDRSIVQLRRQFNVIPQVNPKSITWWDYCAFGPADRIRFVLQPKPSGAACGEVTFWDMGPLSTRHSKTIMGMIRLRIAKDFQRRGLARYLIYEALKHLQSSGVQQIETQALRSEEPAQKLFEVLGFAKRGEGILFQK